MTIVPFSLKDAPSFIEHAFPAQRISIEAQAERKAGPGQTLTGLGGYWKGRKPLVLVRACVIGALMPATTKPEKDLEIFELLMAMDDAAFNHRAKKVSAEDLAVYGAAEALHVLGEGGKWLIKGAEKQDVIGRIVARMPYASRLEGRSLRPEECHESAYSNIWTRVNEHLGTAAQSHTELVEQLGVMRFGHRPKVADTFAGGGSIPFEAARLGCEVYASDLNPVACMLTWGALNIVGGGSTQRVAMAAAQASVIRKVNAILSGLQFEYDGYGNRAKAYLYCLEVQDPQTGWHVPLSTSWIVSLGRRCVAKLIPIPNEKRFDIEVVTDASDEELVEAERGTMRNGELVYTINRHEYRISMKTLRGDRVGESNDLRPWERLDFQPHSDDKFQERVYAIQWSRSDDPHDIFYTAFRDEDAVRDEGLTTYVRLHLAGWQADGLVPSMRIQPGKKTDEPIRTRGWTHWHHLFPPHQLLMLATVMQAIRETPIETQPALLVLFANALDKCSKLTQWRTRAARPGRGGAVESPEHVFYNQALNVFSNYGTRLFAGIAPMLRELPGAAPVCATSHVATRAAASVDVENDIYITDPPYADAVAYEEITEFFIAWLRKDPPGPFADWTWDSRRDLAVKGSGDDFRREMVRAYSAMTQHMPDNGLQIVMFTHQDGGVWADMANIFWGAGLKVTAAWYIATETSSALKKGGYVQGTVILVLRKRLGAEATYTNEVVEEIRQEVARQIETLTGLNQSTRAGRDENLFNDADLQMAGFAAALRVLTHYTHIDDQDMTREALRPRVSGETTLAERLIDHAVQIANEYLVPEGLHSKDWDQLNGSERFYLRMLDVEEAGGKKLDSYQNFAKAFKVRDFGPMMASQKPNDAQLKSALELKKGELSGSELGTSTLRAILFALYELQSDVEPDDVMSHLRDMVPGYMRKRDLVSALARYLALKLAKLRPPEAEAARVLTGLVKNEKVGG